MASVSSRPDVAVFNELAAIDRLAAIHIERLLPGQMSAAQFGVLGRLVAGGAQTPTELANGLALSKATMSHALARLAGAGLIDINADAKDGRRKQIGITPAGESAFVKGSGALSPMMLALRTSFPAEEFEAALPFLTRLRAWLQSGGAGPA
jgi:DNA-binding MarR family transcriptional regulator